MGRMPGISPPKDLPRLIYHRRALSKELLLRAVTGTSFFTTGGESRIQSFSETRRAAPSLCDGSVDSRAIVLKTRLSFLKPTRFTFSASIFRRATNQPAIQNRNTYVKWKEILVMPAQRFGPYSVRSAWITSTLAARAAGTIDATTAMVTSTTADNTTGKAPGI